MEYEIHNQTKTRQLLISSTYFTYQGKNIDLVTTIPDGLEMYQKETLPSGLNALDSFYFLRDRREILSIDINELRCISPDTCFQYQLLYPYLDEMIYSVKLYDIWIKKRHELNDKNVHELFVLV
ncbi:hypothetical protein [Serratia marcescens]|uniref:hypothetical protein n=1 Tax=Serratia marcescens TaxID=615 RepID=UPI001D35325B|nr:hypothetical protein [Serratia marcescens]CAE7299146.1 hypothetical protein AI2618V1_1894 [Serratia marcescens]CAE7299299.1 hypothetical protein AI2617V1_1887 [Serratia marcescens]CAH3648182.1 hypothetical protein AI2618V1_1894 [Serratia marcescens]CAH3945276.1 hypothetical protein AI2617V1_1887 [Serratia marcescens]